jgi:TRAP-type uncharacterized transport system substrate-binding protein
LTDLSQRADIRVVPYAPGQLERVLAQVPFYRSVVMAKGVFRGVNESVTQVGVINVLVSHESVPEELVRDMTGAIVENLDVLPRLNGLFKGLKDLFEPLRSQGAAALEFGEVALHPGAIRAYRESGWLQ